MISKTRILPVLTALIASLLAPAVWSQASMTLEDMARIVGRHSQILEQNRSVLRAASRASGIEFRAWQTSSGQWALRPWDTARNSFVSPREFANAPSIQAHMRKITQRRFSDPRAAQGVGSAHTRWLSDRANRVHSAVQRNSSLIGQERATLRRQLEGVGGRSTGSSASVATHGAGDATRRVSREAGEEILEEGGRRVSREAGEEILEEGGRRVSREAGEEILEEGGRRVSREAGEEILEEGGRRVGREVVEEGSEEALERASRTAAHEGAGAVAKQYAHATKVIDGLTSNTGRFTPGQLQEALKGLPAKEAARKEAGFVKRMFGKAPKLTKAEKMVKLIEAVKPMTGKQVLMWSGFGAVIHYGMEVGMPMMMGQKDEDWDVKLLTTGAGAVAGGFLGRGIANVASKAFFSGMSGAMGPIMGGALQMAMVMGMSDIGAQIGLGKKMDWGHSLFTLAVNAATFLALAKFGMSPFSLKSIMISMAVGMAADWVYGKIFGKSEEANPMAMAPQMNANIDPNKTHWLENSRERELRAVGQESGDLAEDGLNTDDIEFSL